MAYAWGRTSKKFTAIERQTLERLKDDERFGSVWQTFQPHLKERADEGRLIACIVFAARRTLEGRRILRKQEENIIRWKQARQAAENLCNFLNNRPTGIGYVNTCADALIQPLSAFLQAMDRFKMVERESDPKRLAVLFGFSPQFVGNEDTTASTFVRELNKCLKDNLSKQFFSKISGKPFHGFHNTVGLIAGIVLKQNVTKHQVRSARRPTARSGRLPR